MPRQIAHDLVAPHRMADQHGVAQVERIEHRGQVIGQRVEVVAAAGIAGAPVAAAVEGDRPAAGFLQRQHLV